MELADVTDSKSVGLTPVWVRIPPLASQPLAENLRAVFCFSVGGFRINLPHSATLFQIKMRQQEQQYVLADAYFFNRRMVTSYLRTNLRIRPRSGYRLPPTWH